MEDEFISIPRFKGIVVVLIIGSCIERWSVTVRSDHFFGFVLSSSKVGSCCPYQTHQTKV